MQINLLQKETPRKRIKNIRKAATTKRIDNWNIIQTNRREGIQ